MISYRIQRHRKRQHATDNHMVMVPFIDVLVILVVFLLFQSSEVEVLPNTKTISIPQSVAQTKPRATVVVMVTKNEVLVDGKTVISIAAVSAGEDVVIAPLKRALLLQSDRVLDNALQQAADEREVTIMADRQLPYSVLKKIMATCTEANYGKVSLAVTEKDTATHGAT